MSDGCAFTILGMRALALGWPTWLWAIAFALVAVDVFMQIVDQA